MLLLNDGVLNEKSYEQSLKKIDEVHENCRQTKKPFSVMFYQKRQVSRLIVIFLIINFVIFFKKYSTFFL